MARLFSASARDWGQTHLEVYSEALENVPDDVGELAGKELALFVDWNNPPSIKMVKEKVNAIIARGDTGLPALEEENNPVVADDEARKAGLEAALSALGRLPRADQPARRPDMPGPPKMKVDAHSMGDHQFCGPECDPPEAGEPESFCAKLGPRGEEGLPCGLPEGHEPPCYYGTVGE